MNRETIELVAAAAEDERQLDGRRYLELVGEHQERPLEAMLRLVLSREGRVDEAELILLEDEASAAILLETPADVDELEPLALQLGADSVEIQAEQAEDGEYRLTLSVDRALLRAEAAG